MFCKIGDFYQSRMKRLKVMNSTKENDNDSENNQNWESIDPELLTSRDRYHLCISSIAPRPVAVISSVSKIDGNRIVNCAPFSYTNIMAHNPPTVVHGLCLSDGKKKDTLRNIEATGEWVFNVLTKEYLGKCNECSAALPPDVSEVEINGLTPIECKVVSVPRLSEAAVAMECKLIDKKEIYNDAGDHTCTIVIGKVVLFHVRRSVIKDTKPLAVDLDKVEYVGRAGDTTYWPVGVTPNSKLAMKRP